MRLKDLQEVLNRTREDADVLAMDDTNGNLKEIVEIEEVTSIRNGIRKETIILHFLNRK